MFKIIQSGEFLRSLLSKLAGPLIKVAIPLAKNVLSPLGITAAASAFGSWCRNSKKKKRKEKEKRYMVLEQQF